MPQPPAAAANFFPEEFECSISTEIMKDPVILSDGHSYEREDIAKWFKKNNTSPITNSVVDRTVMPNRALKAVIEGWTATTAVASAASARELIEIKAQLEESKKGLSAMGAKVAERD